MSPLQLARFWDKVAKSDGCWEWTGARGDNGYGHVGGGTTSLRGAHRVAYELTKGPIPPGLEIDHLCFVRHCVNPAHLEAVTAAENSRRRAERQTHCKRGHGFTPDNTYNPPGKPGSRVCRSCQSSRERTYEPAPAPTHCKSGLHEWTQENTIRTARQRLCRPCVQAYERARYLARKAVSA